MWKKWQMKRREEGKWRMPWLCVGCRLFGFVSLFPSEENETCAGIGIRYNADINRFLFDCCNDSSLPVVLFVKLRYGGWVIPPKHNCTSSRKRKGFCWLMCLELLWALFFQRLISKGKKRRVSLFHSLHASLIRKKSSSFHRPIFNRK